MICVAVLAIVAGGMGPIEKWLGWVLEKEPIALRRKLDLMDTSALGPYRVEERRKLENKDVLKELGTEDYIDWTLEDSGASQDSPTRFCSLFVTYYDMPDRVPHVPEECYVGGGNTRLSRSSVTLNLSETAGDRFGRGIDVRYLTFGKKRNSIWQNDAFPVMYVFRVNDEYANSRGETRAMLKKNMIGKHSYFSKIEWQFWGRRFGQKIVPNKEQAVKASERLMSFVLSLLEGEHWPILNELKCDSATATAGGAANEDKDTNSRK